jgi:hypothetical protein
VDPGVDLRRTQLLKGGAVGTTWTQIQPHLGLSPLGRLDPATENCS